jgi:hypothetical protein
VASLLGLVDERRSPDAGFWLQLTVGAVILLAAAWLFGKVAEDVVTGTICPIPLLQSRPASSGLYCV